MKYTTTIPLALSILLLASLSGAVADSPDFLIEMKILESGEEIAAPRMMIAEGVEASTSLSGEDSVVVGLVVNSSSEGEAHVLAEVEANGSSLSPEILVNKGSWASVSVGSLEFQVRVQDLPAN
jgi:hypothetical protein